MVGITDQQAKERPILFTGEMVRAILDGRKTQTRRVVQTWAQGLEKLQYDLAGRGFLWYGGMPDQVWSPGRQATRCPYGVVGDRLWVRETWQIGDELRPTEDAEPISSRIYYRADPRNPFADTGPWRPSIYMPRWASRITLEVTEIRVERLQAIGEADALAEGDPKRGLIASENTHRDWFSTLWDDINGQRADGAYQWDRNPWVWVIEFRRDNG